MLSQMESLAIEPRRTDDGIKHKLSTIARVQRGPRLPHIGAVAPTGLEVIPNRNPVTAPKPPTGPTKKCRRLAVGTG